MPHSAAKKKKDSVLQRYNFSQIGLWVQYNTNQNPKRFLIDRLILKLWGNAKGPRISKKTSLKKSKVGRFELSDVKTFKGLVIKTV